MHYLVDTHVLLWWVSNSNRLETSIKQAIADPQNSVYVSVVSGLEISIKSRSGKVKLKTTLQDCFEKSGFQTLNFTLPHALTLDKLPMYHKDPFDRILIAQSQVENLTLITGDERIRKYDVSVLRV